MNLENGSKERIGYFDLMKGVCIVLVIIGHCLDEKDIKLANVHVWSMLEHLRMPLYFFLSGMFFKEYSGFVDFIVRKSNKLVIPFLSFCLLSSIPMIVVGQIGLDFESVRKHCTWMLKFGGYLWFLRTLFFANVFYYIYNKVTKNCNLFVRVLALCFVVVLGWIMNYSLPVDMDYRQSHTWIFAILSSVIVLPLIFVASSIRPLLAKFKNLRMIDVIIIGILSLVVCYYTSIGGVHLKDSLVDNNPFAFYVASFSAVTSCWSVCFLVKKLPYVTYVGRYSIIAYLVHYPLLKAVVYVWPEIDLYLVILIILLSMPVFIWLFKTYLPAFVAQRDVFVYENNRIKLNKDAFSLKKR